ncbi:MAG: helix-turn-helix transcriptional regulator [Desulfosporosinus sp.]|nr:helix-turn-helix transcriptional regulator [Desulfosporosinus sp.]
MEQISLDTLGIIVEQKRKGLGWTQEELGEKTDINRQMIGRIETGKYLPSLPQLNSLLSLLDIEFYQIVEQKATPNIFMALLGATKTEDEKDGFRTMIDMMLCLRKHDRLRGIINE